MDSAGKRKPGNDPLKEIIAPDPSIDPQMVTRGHIPDRFHAREAYTSL
jgi:hypothetical protein